MHGISVVQQKLECLVSYCCNAHSHTCKERKHGLVRNLRYLQFQFFVLRTLDLLQSPYLPSCYRSRATLTWLQIPKQCLLHGRIVICQQYIELSSGCSTKSIRQHWPCNKDTHYWRSKLHRVPSFHFVQETTDIYPSACEELGLPTFYCL